jgi:hypothetical protein
VQAAQAGNLAVTAVACVPLLGIWLAARHWVAVLAVCAGLAVLGASSGAEGTIAVGTGMILLDEPFVPRRPQDGLEQLLLVALRP